MTIPITPDEMPHIFDGRSKSGIKLTIDLRLPHTAYDDSDESLAEIKTMLDQAYAQMETRLHDHLADRRIFLDALKEAKQKIGQGRMTQEDIASEMGMTLSTFERRLERHFPNAPGYNGRFNAALDACENETRGKMFMG
jgi:hypothetical protein